MAGSSAGPTPSADEAEEKDDGLGEVEQSDLLSASSSSEGEDGQEEDGQEEDGQEDEVPGEVAGSARLREIKSRERVEMARLALQERMAREGREERRWQAEQERAWRAEESRWNREAQERLTNFYLETLRAVTAALPGRR